MNILYVIHRYLDILRTPKEERKKKWVPRSIMFGGKSAPGYVNYNNSL
jgi:starch phosphorylase